MTEPHHPGAAAPVAFMSYAQTDDNESRLSKFRERLADELRAQTGRRIAIFQNAEDIGVGEQWRQRLAEGLAASTFLLPIITPSFLMSRYCREELGAFLDKELALGRADLILPIYYIDCQDFLTSTADAPGAAVLRSVLERQYFDWRPLRLLSPSEARVRRERERLAARIREAMARVTEMTPSLSTPSADIQGVQQAAPRELPDTLDALFDRDPVVSFPAARYLAECGTEAIPAIVDRVEHISPPTIFVLRWLLAQFPEVSAHLMVKRIRTADDNWHAASLVPDCLTPAHRQMCESDLAALLDSAGVDVVRKAIEALGYVGSTAWAYKIAEVVRDTSKSSSAYFYEKYSGYCVEALARIATQTPLTDVLHESVTQVFPYLESTVKLIGARGWQSITYPNLQTILAYSKPQHADRLTSTWLASAEQDHRDLAAYGLGGIGLRRVVPALLERSADVHETKAVRSTSMFAAGVIGGAVAVDGLSALDLDPELTRVCNNSLAMCVGDAANDVQFRELADRIISGEASERCWVYRAIGRRRDEQLLPRLRTGLHDGEASVRGDASLALARLCGADEREALSRARSEASSSRERVLTSVAALSIGDNVSDDPELQELRALLAAESSLYRSATQRDILESLQTSSHPCAAAVAAAWEPIYATSSAY